ncbi:HlyC/CorC family transporter [Candidatus Woesearchaeota archaeon]|nr:HlyC/CorC family transporter [Candidatus Woesearchaeota archaeon]
MAILADIIILAALVVMSAFASASESALFSLNRYQVDILYEKGSRGTKNLKKILSDPHKLLITLLLFNNLVNISASAYATIFFARLFESNVIGITTGIMTFFILVFGEITPKTIALKYNKSLSLSFAGIIRVMQIIFYPLISVLGLFVDVVHKVLGLRKSSSALSEEELKSIVAISEREGSINPSEMKLINSVFRFDNMVISDVMTPRTKIVYGNSKMALMDIVRLSKETGHSRFPIYERDRDNVIGIAYLKDMLSYIEKGKLSLPVAKVMKKATIVPETKKLSTTLKLFQKRRVHMAIVVDEYGGVVGLATMEDILEEIVGEIVDEAEKAGPKVVRLNADTFRVLGDTDIAKVNKKLNLRIEPSPDYDTLGGFILSNVGRIPKKGEELKIKNLLITIEEVSRNRIESVRVVKK